MTNSSTERLGYFREICHSQPPIRESTYNNIAIFIHYHSITCLLHTSHTDHKSTEKLDSRAGTPEDLTPILVEWLVHSPLILPPSTPSPHKDMSPSLRSSKLSASPPSSSGAKKSLPGPRSSTRQYICRLVTASCSKKSSTEKTQRLVIASVFPQATPVWQITNWTKKPKLKQQDNYPKWGQKNVHRLSHITLTNHVPYLLRYP